MGDGKRHAGKIVAGCDLSNIDGAGQRGPVQARLLPMYHLLSRAARMTQQFSRSRKTGH